MRKIIALALAVVMSVSLLCLPAAAKATGVRDFTDVSADFWARAKIDEVVKEGWFNGTTSTTFAPNEYMTRGQFVAVLARFDGVKLTDSNTKFSDVPSTKYYAPAVKWAEANGIVTGYSDGTFRPNAPITRQQIAACRWVGCILNKLCCAGSSGAVSEIFAARFGILRIAGVPQNLLYSCFDPCDGVRLQQDTCIYFCHPSCHGSLFIGLGIKYHRSSHIQAFGNAVHAAVGNKNIGF